MRKEKNKNYIEGVSVVIVTYNGSERLVPTLSHLAKQKEINFNFEVLLIDNNSNDGTSEKTLEIWESLGNPFPFRVILEPTPGTMYARKKGIEESRYRYMLYCDDDNWLCADYVSIAHKMIKDRSDIAVVGGRGSLVYEEGFTPPKWIRSYEKNYGTEQADKDGDLTDTKGCLFTAGALLDRKWLDKLYQLGFKSSLTGRIGKSLVAGEDTELTYALKIIGGRLFYFSKMNFKHYMPPNRMQWSYLRRLYFAYGVADYIIYPYNNFFANRKNPSNISLFLSTIKSILILFFKLKLSSTYDGDIRQLLLEKKKGELKSIFYFCSKRKEAKQMIALLKKETNFKK